MSSTYPPEGINPTVYKTQGGQVFHNSPECALLARGQSSAYTTGLTNHPINPISYNAVAELGACTWCCAYFHYLKEPPRYLEVKVGSSWEKMQFLTKRPIGHGHYEFRVRRESTGEEFDVRKKQINF
jgi:hypothetical protein